MQEFHRRVTAVTPVPHAEETSTALLAGATLIPLEDSGDFTEAGGHVRILGEVYTYSAMDEGDESGVPSITLDSGLLSDVPAETLVEEWNDAKEEVVTDWVATVTDEDDGSSNSAYLTHALIALIATGIPLVGESVTVRADDNGTWWVTEVHGATPGYDPGFIRTGGLGADTVVWAGEENGRRAQLDGIDGALECFNDANEQTVNLDGDTNYIEGSLATAASGGRVEMGAGASGLDDVNEVRLHTENANETAPASLRASSSGSTSILALSAAEVNAPHLGVVQIIGDSITVSGGNLGATMGSGSVGTGTFRDSVDARVAAYLAGLGHIERTVDGTQTIATATTTTALWQTSVVTARGGISYDAGTGVFTVTVAGRYMVTASVVLTANTTGRRLLQLRRNGTIKYGENMAAPSAGNGSVNVVGVFDCVNGDTIDVRVTQDSGSTLTVLANSNVSVSNLG